MRRGAGVHGTGDRWGEGHWVWHSEASEGHLEEPHLKGRVPPVGCSGTADGRLGYTQVGKGSAENSADLGDGPTSQGQDPAELGTQQGHIRQEVPGTQLPILASRRRPDLTHQGGSSGPAPHTRRCAASPPTMHASHFRGWARVRGHARTSPLSPRLPQVDQILEVEW